MACTCILLPTVTWLILYLLILLHFLCTFTRSPFDVLWSCTYLLGRQSAFLRVLTNHAHISVTAACAWHDNGCFIILHLLHLWSRSFVLGSGLKSVVQWNLSWKTAPFHCTGSREYLAPQIATWIQWNLSWETTAMRDHLSWHTTHFWQDLHFNITEPVTRDHMSWKTTFLWQMGWSFKIGSTASQFHVAVRLSSIMWPALTNHVVTGAFWSFSESWPYSVFMPFLFLQVYSGNFPTKGLLNITPSWTT